MIGKKGALQEHVVSIIVFALVVVLIIGMVVIIIYNFSNTEAKNAKKLLESISEKANLLSDGAGQNYTLTTFSGGENWYLISFNKEDKGLKRPQKCFFDNCICICKKGDGPAAWKPLSSTDNSWILNNLVSDCDSSDSFCRKFSDDKISMDVQIRSISGFGIFFTFKTWEGGKYKLPYIPVKINKEDLIFGLGIEKNKGEIKLHRLYDESAATKETFTLD